MIIPGAVFRCTVPFHGIETSGYVRIVSTLGSGVRISITPDGSEKHPWAIVPKSDIELAIHSNILELVTEIPCILCGGRMRLWDGEAGHLKVVVWKCNDCIGVIEL